MRTRSILLAGVAAVICARATTLLRLGMDDMIRQSTGIVRARVTGVSTALRGQDVYTFYHLQVLETAKPFQGRAPQGQSAQNQSKQVDVAVPGGTFNGMRQVVVGAPALETGSQYVVFLWTGKSGLTQIMGLSQGLFLASEDASGKINLTRPAAQDLMLDQSGKPVESSAQGLAWSELRSRILKDYQQEQGK